MPLLSPSFSTEQLQVEHRHDCGKKDPVAIIYPSGKFEPKTEAEKVEQEDLLQSLQIPWHLYTRLAIPNAVSLEIC